jgi:glycosyltransferase involved in cell wall biosynthesis
LRILITNRVLLNGSGTETVTRDLALELRKLGHEAVTYSPVVGPVAKQIRAQGTPVFTDIHQINFVPDVIHGHHHAQALTALLQFPDTPAIFVCHDATAWHDDPLIFPRVLRYVAVDHRCQKRFEETPQIPRENIRVLFNAVDLSRFKPRPLLPGKPRRAAIFSNYATKETHTNPVTRACKRLGIALDVIGKGFNTSTFKPEEVLPAYDIVFAKARCALEAMAVGSAVVLCDFPGLGAMVDCANFTQLRQLNFGAGALVHPLDPELIAAEINKYDAHEAHRVSERARADACLTGAAVEWLELYNEVIAENALLNQQRDENRQSEELAAMANYLVKWGYDARIELEKSRLKELVDWPILGRCVTWAMERERQRMRMLSVKDVPRRT